MTWRVGVAVALVVGCAGELEHPERFTDCPPGYVEELFAEACGGPCHAGAMPEAGLDLVSPGVADRVVGAMSATEACDGRMLVDPGSDEHLLLDKLGSRPSCGGRMPFGQTQLPASQIECVRRWIDEAVDSAGGGS
ncbi:MAG TPA: hypothetical protein VM734_34395 [Kofleriaceae bacterium]|nr:hypothetical protein [Kofleriaceae bacterium]